MNLLPLTPVFQSLSRLGSTGFSTNEAWIDYPALGISGEQIPALIGILHDIEDNELSGCADAADWLPLHAWRALAQLHAVEAIPVLIGLLNRIDGEDDETIQVDLPRALSLLAPESLPALDEFLGDLTNGMWARLSAADALHLAGLARPDCYEFAVSALSQALESYALADPVFNGLLIDYLIKLNAWEAAPLVERAYASGRVDESICGDWEDFQVSLGLIAERLTAPAHYQISPLMFSDGWVRPESGRPGKKAGGRQEKNISRKAAKKKRSLSRV